MGLDSSSPQVRALCCRVHSHSQQPGKQGNSVKGQKRPSEGFIGPVNSASEARLWKLQMLQRAWRQQLNHAWTSRLQFHSPTFHVRLLRLRSVNAQKGVSMTHFIHLWSRAHTHVHTPSGRAQADFNETQTRTQNKNKELWWNMRVFFLLGDIFHI